MVLLIYQFYFIKYVCFLDAQRFYLYLYISIACLILFGAISLLWRSPCWFIFGEFAVFGCLVRLQLTGSSNPKYGDAEPVHPWLSIIEPVKVTTCLIRQPVRRNHGRALSPRDESAWSCWLKVLLECVFFSAHALREVTYCRPARCMSDRASGRACRSARARAGRPCSAPA